MIREGDKDNDGKISFDEFRYIINDCPIGASPDDGKAATTYGEYRPAPSGPGSRARQWHLLLCALYMYGRCSAHHQATPTATSIPGHL